MAEYLIQGETLTGLANVVRSKFGNSTTPLSIDAMAININRLSDVSNDTVTADKMLSGTTAHDKSGTKITGSIATKTASNMTVSGATVTAPAGYYASAQSKSVATATQATPSISVDSAGKITASATQTAGYVSAGTKSATKQLTVQAAQTITPGTTDKTIASGRYLTGTQTIKGDANLVPENIASGVSIFGVEGTMTGGTGGGTCTFEIKAANDSGLYVAYVGGQSLATVEGMSQAQILVPTDSLGLGGLNIPFYVAGMGSSISSMTARINNSLDVTVLTSLGDNYNAYGRLSIGTSEHTFSSGDTVVVTIA